MKGSTMKFYKIGASLTYTGFPLELETVRISQKNLTWKKFRHGNFSQSVNILFEWEILIEEK